MSIYDATADGAVVCAMGENRSYCIGDTAYRFERQKPGMTLPRFARGISVTWIDGEWKRVPLRDIIRNWSDVVTVL
jgi:hypothetical protein